MLPFSDELIPKTRTGAYALLESAGFEPNRLTVPQRQAIRKLYRIDGDNRSVEQLVKDGEVQL